MDIALAQKNRAGGSTSTLPSVSCTFLEPNVAGRTLVAIARLDDDTGVKIPVISDSLNNNWSQIVTARNASTPRLSIWYAPNCKAGLNTVTMTPPAAAAGQLLFIFEYRGALESASADGSNSSVAAMQVGTDACTSGNITTTRDNDLLLACLMETTGAGGYGTVAVGTGFTLVDQTDVGPGAYGRCTVEQKICGAAGTYAGTYTHTVAFPAGIIVAAAFKRLQLTDALAPAFPATPVLDTCTRADENPATGWTAAIYSGNVAPRIVGNRLVAAAAGTTSGYLSRASFANDAEFYFTMNDLGGGDINLTWAINEPGTAGVDNYVFSINQATNIIRLFSFTNGALGPQIGADINQVLTNGDSIGVRRLGSRIELWYKVGSGLWKRIFTATSTVWNAGGRAGIFFGNTTQKISNVGGGSISVLQDYAGWTVTRGSVGATVNDQPTFTEYTFDDKSVRKDWK
jgi:hypothetical protein